MSDSFASLTKILQPWGILACLLVASTAAPQALPSSPSSASQDSSGPGLQSLSPAAQGSISEALGRESASYAARPSSEGFDLENVRHGLQASVSAQGLRFDQGQGFLSLSLSRWGRADALSCQVPGPSPAPVAVGTSVSARENRVELLHARGLTEWFVNGPLGLQQGFTLTQRPASGPSSRPDSPLMLELAVQGASVSEHPSDLRSLRLTLQGSSQQLLYSGLMAYDATGRELPSRLESQSGRIRLVVEDAGPSTPSWWTPSCRLPS